MWYNNYTIEFEFEFDKTKSISNGKKHGIDFVEAQELWDDPDRIEVPAKTQVEKRYVLTGRISNKHWSAVFTLRENRVRIISVRRARSQEVEEYESSSISTDSLDATRSRSRHDHHRD